MNRRRHSRYDVSDFLPLKGSVSPVSSAFQLVTISSEGCGFWTGDMGSTDLPEKRAVVVHFQLEGFRPIQVSGTVMYKYPQPFKNQLGHLVGVRFLETEFEKVRPIIQAIESHPKYRNTSEIKIALS